MDIVLYSGDNVDGLFYMGVPVLEQPHRVIEDMDGRTIIQVGDMNELAADAERRQTCLSL